MPENKALKGFECKHCGGKETMTRKAQKTVFPNIKDEDFPRLFTDVQRIR